MIIQVDREGRKVIEQLCDIALKQGGVQNLNQVNKILALVMNEISVPKSNPVGVEKEIKPEVKEKKVTKKTSKKEVKK